MERVCLFFLLSILNAKCVFGQINDSLHISFFADTYFSWFSNGSIVEKSDYVVNYHRIKNLDLNFAAAGLLYQRGHFRTNLGIMTGSYVNRNMAQEDTWARNIYEANIGYRFTADEDIWLDIGVLPSHIGFESIPAHSNWSASRSLVAELSPYYETGLRLSYRPNSNWYFSIMSLNGWQRITAPLKHLGESWGMQISVQPKKNWLINTSSFIGKVSSSTQETTRIYSNIYSSIEFHPGMWFMAGWDWGMQDNSKNQWNDLMIQYRYAIAKNIFFGNLRYEYLSDPQSVFRPDLIGANHRIHLGSLNFDYLPIKQCLLRAEVNYQLSSDKIFKTNQSPVDHQLAFLLIASIKLDYAR